MESKIRSEEKYHDNVAKEYTDVREYDYIWEIPEQMYLLRKEYLVNRSILEVGCGPAISLRNAIGFLKINRISYTGIDISKQMLNFARVNMPTGRFIQGSFDSIVLKKKFDTIISLGALHHAPSQKKAFKHWLSYLKPGGYILLREPLIHALKMGEGASPIEEGICEVDLQEIANMFDCTLVNRIYFSSKLMHFLNMLQIKILRSLFSRNRTYWYLLTKLDVFFSNSLLSSLHLFKGEAVVLIYHKK